MSVITGKRKWVANHAPGNNAQATITKAAPGAGYRNICTGITVAVACGASAPTAAIQSVALIDGASGGLTYLWGPMPISAPAVAGALNGFVVLPCHIEGTANTAMTLEFSAALGNNTSEGVWMDGYVAPAS